MKNPVQVIFGYGRTVVAFASRLNSREKALGLAIAGVLVLFWAASLLRSFRDERDALANLAAAGEARASLLTAAPIVRTALKNRSAELEVARTLDAEAVMARMEKLLAQAKLSAETSRPVTREAGVSRAHVVTLRTESAAMGEIVAFRHALDDAGLPLAITGLELESNSTDPAKLRARIEITALQPK